MRYLYSFAGCLAAFLGSTMYESIPVSDRPMVGYLTLVMGAFYFFTNANLSHLLDKVTKK